MTSYDIAVEIMDDLGNPDNISTGYTQSWIIDNIGKLNVLLQTCYVYDTGNALGETFTGIYSGTSGDILTGSYFYFTGVSGWSGSFIYDNSGVAVSGLSGTYPVDASFIPDLNGPEKDIYKTMFDVRYYTRLNAAFLGAAGVDSWVEIKEFDTSIRRTAKTDVAKIYATLSNQAQAWLETLLFYYRQGKSPPRMVAGDDTIAETVGPLNYPYGGNYYRSYRNF